MLLRVSVRLHAVLFEDRGQGHGVAGVPVTLEHGLQLLLDGGHAGVGGRGLVDHHAYPACAGEIVTRPVGRA